MAKIEQYTRLLTVARDVPTLTDPNAISNAGALARGGAKLADFAADRFDAHEKANEATALNEASISFQKDRIIKTSEARKSRESNPFGFAKQMEADNIKLAGEYGNTLSSERAKKAWRETVAQQNLQYFKSDFTWEQQKAVDVYAARTEKAANDLKEMAYIAGRNGESPDGIMKNIGATVVSVSTYQPNKDMLSEVNKKMTANASMGYLRGFSKADPVKAFEYINSGALDKKLGAEKSDKLKSAMAKEALQALAAEDIDSARKFLETNKMFSPKEKAKFKVALDKELESQNTQKATASAVSTSDALIGAINGGTAAGVMGDDTISDDQKKMIVGLMSGDPQVVAEAAGISEAASDGYEGVNLYSMVSEIDAVQAEFESGKQSNATINKSVQQLNTLAQVATMAHAFNKGNRGEGLTKAEYQSVIKKVKSLQETLYDGADKKAPAFFQRHAFDEIFKEVDHLGSSKEERARLLGEALSIAERQGIDVFDRKGDDEAAKIKPVMDELTARRKHAPGIRSSAPKTNIVIKDGEKINVGGGEDKTPADRSVNTQIIKRTYNPNTRAFE